MTKYELKTIKNYLVTEDKHVCANAQFQFTKIRYDAGLSSAMEFETARHDMTMAYMAHVKARVAIQTEIDAQERLERDQ